MPAWLPALLTSLLGTGLVRAYALRLRLLDQPGDARRNHAAATPRGGGMALWLVMLVVFAWLGSTHAGAAGAWWWWALALGLAGGIGAWDDHRPLPIALRLGVQLLAAGAAAHAVLRVGGPPWLAGAALLAVPVTVNFWNFMDGINGIAALQAVIVALAAAALLEGEWRLLALTAAAAGLGFLPWNFPRARIFMGDVGSGSLGLLIACLWTGCALASDRAALLLAFPLAAFLVDAGLTILTRMRAGEIWWQPHSRHSYQLAARRWGSHARVSMLYAAWSIAGAMFGWMLRESANIFIMFCLGAWYTGTVIGWAWLRRRPAHDQTGSSG